VYEIPLPSLTYLCISGVGISCLDVDDDASGKSFNVQPVAVFDMSEASNTCKVLRETFLDLKRVGEYGIYLRRGEEENSELYIHKAFIAMMWTDGRR
jgi:hypothetical protein